MRPLILSVLAIAAVAAFSGTMVQASGYPFCRKGEAGPGDCKYNTYEQCLAAVSGTSGYCQPNFWLSPSDPALSGARTPLRQRFHAQGGH